MGVVFFVEKSKTIGVNKGEGLGNLALFVFPCRDLFLPLFCLQGFGVARRYVGGILRGSNVARNPKLMEICMYGDL